MRVMFRAVFGIALAAALAGCSHGAGSVAPTGAFSQPQSVGSQPGDFARPFGNAVPVCGPAGPNEARCFSFVRTDIPARTGLSPNSVGGYHPADLIAAYNLPGGTAGTGQTIAIADAFDDPKAESDMGVYRSTFGLPACTTANGCFQKVNQRGKASPLPPVDPRGGWEAEESLDLDMASAICPNCHIILVEANTPSFPDLSKAVDAAVALGANEVSNSYGGYEQNGIKWNSHYNHPGHIITASSGDDGYHRHFPAGSQYVVAVGGTSLVHSSDHRGWSETIWAGASSGCSKVSPKPAWQTDPLCSMRTIADTSAVSDPATGVAVYDTYGGGGWAVFGGTSVASPIIAGVYALAGNAATLNYASSLYGAPVHTLWDVTKGSNGRCGDKYLCTGKDGYDGPSGNGTPRGVGAF